MGYCFVRQQPALLVCLPALLTKPSV
jgi:hypothetical protein